MECPYCFSIDENTVYVINKYTMGSSKGIFYVYCEECGMRDLQNIVKKMLSRLGKSYVIEMIVYYD